jgi:hypothetical protein
MHPYADSAISKQNMDRSSDINRATGVKTNLSMEDTSERNLETFMRT